MFTEYFVHRLTWLVFCSFMFAMMTVAAEADFSRPTPRVEVGAHSAFIKKISASKDGRLLLSVSDDKTARLWDAASGRLRSVLRVPLAAGHEGQLFAGALSPDGALAAVGGFTGAAESGTGTVYIFSTEDATLHRRISKLPPYAIENIAFSQGGEVLALCFADGAGVMFFDWQNLAYLRGDRSATDKILGADFAPNGDFAITTLDGKLLVYGAASGYAQVRTKVLQEGRSPMHVRFSPEGARLAIGFDDDPVFAIVDAASLDTLATVRIADNPQQRGLHIVDWSDDGRYVFAGGETRDAKNSPIYRWSMENRGTARGVLFSSSRISDIRRLPGGAMAFSSGEPEIGVLNANDRVRWRLRGSASSFTNEPTNLRVSRTGSAIEFATGSSATSLRFDIAAPVESMVRRASGSMDVASASLQAPGWDVDVSDEKERLMINGATVSLDHREEVTRWVFTPSSDRVLVGTNWSLRAYSKQAQLAWRRAVPAEVIALNSSGDARFVVAALSDGTIRWFRCADGDEVLSLFVNRNGIDWIAWIPSGYYVSSLAGDNHIGWHVNRGWDKDPDFFRAIQFERVLYRPDIVRRFLETAGAEDATILARDSGGFDIAQLDTFAPPRLRMTPQASREDGRVTLDIHAQSSSLPMQDWTLFVNGIPATPARERSLAGDEVRAFTRKVTLDLPAKLNRIRVESSNGRALGVAELDIEAGRGTTAAPKGDLYIAAIGVSKFADTKIPPLNYAARDAAEFVRAFAAETMTSSFRAVKTWIREDSGVPATADTLAALPDFLATATGNDTVIVFLASHGISDPQGNYFFVPSDGRKADIDRALRGGAADSLVRWDFFVNALSSTAGKRLLVVDTCSSAAIGAGFDVHSLAKRSMSSSFALVAAARGDEESQEYAPARHGLFTYGLLDALRTGFDPNADGKVSLSEAFEHAFDKVQTLRNRAVGPQTPQLAAPEVLADMSLAAVVRARTADRVSISD